MTGTVKSIFKTLVKVPVTIIVAYFIINLVLFSYFYFRFAGVSYVIMQTAMENNYIPETEDKIIKQAIRDIVYHKDENGVEYPSSVIRASGVDSQGNDASAHIIYNNGNKRMQYGSKLTIGVHYTYQWLFPLMPSEWGQRPMQSGTEINDASFYGNNGSSDLRDGASNMSDGELEALRNDNKHKVAIPIDITYTVPALQYYSDLE